MGGRYFPIGEFMKKVIVVSKTHLDLGFTDLAENIRKKYLDEFIPNAIDIAKSVNDGDKKKFVWTTGSYLLNEELENGSEENKQKLISALKSGDIAPHALPFTMHTELLDKESLEYALDLVDKIDDIRGRKTVAAKMTDVPGHTKALVPVLYKKGIRLLHIGVNGASAMPDVPECFLWKVGESEVVVIYSGEYGGAYKNEYVDDILYFDHTLDNHGAQGKSAVLKNIEKIGRKYPDHEVCAGTLDDYAEKIWAVRDKLPVVTSEIGDTWIHGSASDPYKSACLRTLIRLKNEWLSDGTMKKGSDEYNALEKNILCLAEHTCGMDVKIALGEYRNYTKAKFNKARGKSNYKKIESSWAEQREYIKKAVGALSDLHKIQALSQIQMLMPKEAFKKLNGNAMDEYCVSKSVLKLNSFGNIEKLVIDSKTVIENNNKSAITYDSFNQDDYDYWFNHYSRNLKQTAIWSIPDFGKPNIKRCKYPSGRFDYKLKNVSSNADENKAEVLVELEIDSEITEALGAPRIFQIKYTLLSDRLNVELLWLDKDADRLPNSIMYHIYPCGDKVTFTKLDSDVEANDIVLNGNRNLSAVQNVKLQNCKITNYDSPLVSVGKGKILHFDNEYSKLSNGLTFVLYDNVWGTNFPLWYGDNAYFRFTIE